MYGLGMTVHKEFCVEWVRDDNLLEGNLEEALARCFT